uniref:Domain of unknown function DB domain-containing protein n=1 Tax=Pristionchus pacificus TaxID=54126 RepID=A0A8R1YL40_PRIPA
MLLLTFFFLFVTSIDSLDESKIRDLCPTDKSLCANKAAKGDCFGSSLKATVLQKQCACSCDAVHHDRIQTCCRTVGEKEMLFCMPLCSYNTSAEALGSTTGIKCVSQLTTWAYCASDNYDTTGCCKARGVPPECQSFCQGKVPTCDMQSIFQYQGCLTHMRAIMSCQKESLGSKPRYDPDWTSSCEWEGK